jgi:hypothetical protein
MHSHTNADVSRQIKRFKKFLAKPLEDITREQHDRNATRIELYRGDVSPELVSAVESYLVAWGFYRAANPDTSYINPDYINERIDAHGNMTAHRFNFHSTVR